MGRYFAVDLGAESGRCVAGTLENGVLKLDELCRFPTQGLWVCGAYKWNVYRFYEQILLGLKEYVLRYGSKLDSVGVDTWGVDFGLLDTNNQLMSLPYTYRDGRTIGTEAIIEESKPWIYEKTGIQFLEFNTLNQLIGAKRANDTQLHYANKLLFIGDLLHYFLGAQPVCEYSAASISQLVNTSTKAWDDEIFNKFNIPVALQSPIAFAGNQIGVLRDEIADEVGLQRGVAIIAPAVHDTASAAVAVPAKGDDFAYISSGTWSLAGIELDAPVNNQSSYEMNISNSGGVLGKSLFLKNIMGLWIIQQCKKQWNKTQTDLSYGQIVELAQSAMPFYGFIEPDNSMFFNPENMPLAICSFLKKSGQKEVEQDDVGQISRIIYECLALKYKYVFQKICETANKTITNIHIIGGGSQNALLNQFTANATNLAVTAGPVEGTAMGNLLMQAYGCNDATSLTELRQIVCNSAEIIEYSPSQSQKWETAFRQFIEVSG